MEEINNKLVENISLNEEIKKAFRSEGYLFCISRLNAGKLIHSWFTQKFDRNDIPIALAHFNQSLKREMPPTTYNEPPVSEEKRELPPEYREHKDERSA